MAILSNDHEYFKKIDFDKTIDKFVDYNYKKKILGYYNSL